MRFENKAAILTGPGGATGQAYSEVLARDVGGGQVIGS